MRLIRITLTALSLCLLVGGSAHAQVGAAADTGPKIDRGSVELSDAVRVLPEDRDRDFVNTALIFTSTSRTRSEVICLARDGNGQVVGRAWAGVPGRGLRFILASDFGNGADFVGSVKCATNGRMAGTALLLGPTGVTDLPGRRVALDGPVGLVFPVVVTR
jgi:hypothetical protein